MGMGMGGGRDGGQQGPSDGFGGGGGGNGQGGGAYEIDGLMNQLIAQLTGQPKKPNVFEQAGALQSTAATGAGEAQNAGLQQAMELIQSLMGGQSGTDNFGSRLDSVIGGGAFNGLVGERSRAMQGQLSAGGLTRSGTAMQSMAEIPEELALELEQIGFGRESGITQMIAQMLGQQGQNTATGILGSAEAEAGGILGKKAYQFAGNQQGDQNRNNALSLFGGGIGTAIGGPVGGAIGSGIGSLLNL